MRVGVIQSNYLPWRGYFDFIDDVDVFIVFDDVQYTVRDWRNRNRIKTARGATWITVSLKNAARDARIQEMEIDWEAGWPLRHLNLLRENYGLAPFYDEIATEFAAALAIRPARLSELNVALMRWVNSRLGIDTPFVDAGSLRVEGRRTDRLIGLVRAVGGSTYLSGPSAESYLDLDAFREAGVALEYKSYDYAPYPQLWGSFEGAVSILDLLMMTGPDARAHLKSRSPNRRVPL